MIVIPSVARDLLFSFLQFLLSTLYFPPPPAVIPTEATQLLLPISLPVRWLGCAVEGPLFALEQRVHRIAVPEKNRRQPRHPVPP